MLIEVVEQTNGSVVKGMGDGILATFSGAADAVSAAVAMQQAVHGWDTGEVGRQVFRVGLSAGDVTWDDGDCFGTPGDRGGAARAPSRTAGRSSPPTSCGSSPAPATATS